MDFSAVLSERPAQSVRKGPGLDDGDAQAERREFGGQRLRQAFDGEFGGVVVAGAGKADEAADGADIHHVAGAAGAHAGQRRLGHGDEAEHVGFEHGAYFGILAFLDGGQVAVAGVVHEHVQAAELRLGGGDGGGDLARIVHVERQSQSAILVAGDEILHAGRVARGDDGAAAALQDGFRQFAAEARGAACG